MVLEHFRVCRRLSCPIHSAFFCGMGGKPTEFRSAQFPKNALAVPCREQARSAANTAAVADAKLANTRAARLTPLAPEMVSPGRKPLPAGAVVVQSNSAKGPVSRILSCAVIPLGAASPRTLISDLPGGFGNCYEPPERVGPMRSAA